VITLLADEMQRSKNLDALLLLFVMSVDGKAIKLGAALSLASTTLLTI
jgi:hypothetical protein